MEDPTPLGMPQSADEAASAPGGAAPDRPCRAACVKHRAVGRMADRFLLDDPVETSVLVEATSASLLPAVGRDPRAAVHPCPDRADHRGLRLPATRVMVLFGADLAIDPVAHPWPYDFPAWRHAATHLVAGMITRGGYLSGVVLLADAAGRLHDDCIWVVAAAPDPLGLTRIRLTGSGGCGAAGAAWQDWPR